MLQSIFSQNEDFKKTKSMLNLPQINCMKSVQSYQSNIKDLGIFLFF